MIFGVHEFWSFLLIFTRVTALLVASPAFGSRAVPFQTKIGFSGLLSLALMPIVAPNAPNPPPDLIRFAGCLLAESLVGICLGYFVVLVFNALEIAGSFIDLQIGFGIMNILNPFSEQQSTPMGGFIFQLGLTIFVAIGGPLYLIASLANSYTVVPPAGAHFSGDISTTLIPLAGQMFILAFKIAAPVAGVLLVVDMAFAIIARTVPQMNVFIVGMPAKVLVGLLTVSLVLPVIAIVVGQMLPIAGASTQAILPGLR